MGLFLTMTASPNNFQSYTGYRSKADLQISEYLSFNTHVKGYVFDPAETNDSLGGPLTIQLGWGA